jgi:hypothetical protein
MSTIAATNLKNPSSGSNNIVLGTDGSTRVSTLADSAGANTSTPAEIASGRAKAWVNFNGTGTVAILAQYNVSSITDNGVGDYTVNFATAMVDADYSWSGSQRPSSATNGFYFELPTASGGSRSSSNFRIRMSNSAGNAVDPDIFCASIFR